MNVNINPSVAAKLNSLQPSQTQAQNGGFSFEQTLKETISELNKEQLASDKAMADIATGQVRDLHQAAIAISKAENNMKFMLEVRNKAINAYKEISRTQI